MGLNSWFCVGVVLLWSCQVYGKRGYLMTAPKVFQAGGKEKICFEFFDLDVPVYVSVTLKPDPTETQLYEFPGGKGECVDFPVGMHEQYAADLIITGSTDNGYRFNDTTRVGFTKHRTTTFIQTDKPQYKPGQTVRFRVLSLDANLRPITENIALVWVEDASGTRMAQWRDVVTQKGLSSFELPTSEEPVMGTWKIKVQRTEEMQAEEKTFKVEEYVLPKYEISIMPQSYVSLIDREFSTEICAKYTYGKPVKGRLSVRACITNTYRSERRPCYTVDDLEINGCYKLRGDATVLELQESKYSIYGAKLQISASVTEEATGIVLNKTDESTDIHRHLFKLDFKPHTPEYFKPSLPFHGKLLITHPDGTPMSGRIVTLSIQSWNDFEEDISSNNRGEVIFTIPRTPANYSSFTIMARVKDSPENDYDRNKYTPIAPTGYHNLKEWYSPSGSFLQIEQKEEYLPCDQETELTVLYTSEKDTSFMFHWEVISRGSIVTRGQKRYHFEGLQPIGDSIVPEQVINLGGPVSDQPSEMKPSKKETVPTLPYTATVTIPLHIDHSLSPSAHVLVYYVREDGEVVADSTKLKVQKCLENKVSLEFLPKQVSPGDDTIMHLRASPESLCSVGVVDKSVHVLGGNNQLNPDKIFSMLSEYELNENSGPYIRDSYCEDQMREKEENEEDEDDDDDDEDDEDNGNPFIDVLIPPIAPAGAPSPPRERKQDNEEAAVPAPEGQVEVDEGRRRKKKGRKGRRRQDRQRVPRSMWFGGFYSDYYDSIKAFKSSGMLVLSDLTINSRPCSRHTYIPRRAYASPGGQAGPGAHGPMPIAPVEMDNDVTLESQQTSEKKVDVRTYFPETWLWQLYEMGPDSELELSQEVPHTITDWMGSAFCTNNVAGFGVSETSTLRAFQPFFLSYTLPYSIVRGETAHVPITVFNYLSECIVVELSLASTEQIAVAQGAQKLCVCGNEAKTFKFSATARELGMVNLTATARSLANEDWVCENRIVERISTVQDTAVRQILVEAEGKPEEYSVSRFVCASDGYGKGHAELPLPEVNLVEGSASAYISVIGDVMGPALSNLDKLLKLPTGCGEQNMLKFAPNIFVMQYLEAAGQMTDHLKNKALEYMKIGYQRELNYRHNDGSYSAFGENDDEGSTWLTAFVVRSFAQARPYINIDQDDFNKSIDWFRTINLENGCFRQVGRVLHKGMKGGLADGDSGAGLTAYILIALLDAGVPSDDDMIIGAIRCLAMQEDHDMYTSALITYAFTLLDATYAAQKALMMDKMETMATKEGGMKHWKQPATSPPSDDDDDSYYSPKPVPADVEMTAYMLMATLSQGSDPFSDGLEMVRWLSSQRNANGGFLSTQDTVVALQSLADYAALIYTGDVNLELRFRDQRDADLPMMQVTDSNKLVLQQEKISVPNTINYGVTGSGCALIQANVKYNTIPEAKLTNTFKVRVNVENVRDEYPSGHCSKRRLVICAKFMAKEPSNMAVIEVKMQTGWIPDKMSLKQMMKDKVVGLKRQEISQNMVNLYFDEFTDSHRCVNFMVEEDMEVSNPKAAYVLVYDYYETELSTTVSYNIKRTCGTKEELPNLTPEEYDQISAQGGQAREPVENPFIDNSEKSSCPVCYESTPEDLQEQLCAAKHAFKSIVKKGKVRLISDQLRLPEGLFQKMVMVRANRLGFNVDECDCPILSEPLGASRNLNTRVLILTKEASLIEQQRGSRTIFKLPLSSDAVIMPFESDRVIRRIIARC